jgi:D-glycero-alpha-D-manno-heptose 1-phosphate guanylyltransferase
MMSTAIVLAGGAGTRLQAVLNGRPKCLALVGGKPFIDYVMAHWTQQGITQWIFALGHGAALVQLHLLSHFGHLHIEFCLETSPLGTGGALLQAAGATTNEELLVLNADTLFRGQLQPALALHREREALCTMLLHPMANSGRYGTVQLKPNGEVAGFAEKKSLGTGHINAGCYLIDRLALLQAQLPTAFSFEQEFLAPYASSGRIFGQVQDQFFIDIGTPTDYELAQHMVPSQFPVRPSAQWTLFLDRDGVINQEKENDYINHWHEFKFYPNAAATVANLSKLFGHTVVVTNQKGIGKGVSKAEDVEHIHTRIAEAVAELGGRIDAFFYCPDLDSASPNRKPNPGMAHQAKKAFPTIDFSKSLMVGNNVSDLQFGRNAGMHTAYLRTTKPYQLLAKGLADLEALDLAHLWLLLSRTL